jgi:hypothetical protein
MDPRVFIRWNTVQKKIARKAQCGGFLEMQTIACLHLYPGIKLEGDGGLYHYLNMTSPSAFSYRNALNKLIVGMKNRNELRENEYGQFYLTLKSQEKVSRVLHTIYNLHNFVAQLGEYTTFDNKEQHDAEPE